MKNLFVVCLFNGLISGVDVNWVDQFCNYIEDISKKREAENLNLDDFYFFTKDFYLNNIDEFVRSSAKSINEDEGQTEFCYSFFASYNKTNSSKDDLSLTTLEDMPLLIDVITKFDKSPISPIKPYSNYSYDSLINFLKFIYRFYYFYDAQKIENWSKPDYNDLSNSFKNCLNCLKSIEISDLDAKKNEIHNLYLKYSKILKENKSSQVACDFVNAILNLK